MANTPTAEQIDQIGDALASGRKIEAIKIYRDATGKGLKDAKEFIDALIPELRQKDPDRYARLTATNSTGCGHAMLIVGITLAAIVYGIFMIAT